MKKDIAACVVWLSVAVVMKFAFNASAPEMFIGGMIAVAWLDLRWTK